MHEAAARPQIFQSVYNLIGQINEKVSRSLRPHNLTSACILVPILFGPPSMCGQVIGLLEGLCREVTLEYGVV